MESQADAESGQEAAVVPRNHDITVARTDVSPNQRHAKYRYVLSAKDDDYIIESLEKHRTLAYMAEKIGCCRQSLAEYIHKNPVLQQAFTDAKDSLDDLAELRLFEKINQGDLAAIMFYMPRQMRHRGYGDQPAKEEGDEEPRVILGEISDAEIAEADAQAEAIRKEIEEDAKSHGDTSKLDMKALLGPGATPVAQQVAPASPAQDVPALLPGAAVADSAEADDRAAGQTMPQDEEGEEEVDDW